MNIPKHWQEQISKYLGESKVHWLSRDSKSFIEGVEWLYEELSKAAGEFDDGACDAEITRDGYAEYLGGRGYDEPQAFRNGAHWQFQQCAARVGYALAAHEALESAHVRAIDKIKQLESELNAYKTAATLREYCETIRTVAINPSDSECATTRLDSAGKDE